MYGDLAQKMMFHGTARTLFHWRSWPFGMFAALESTKQEEVVAQFRIDHDAFQQLKTKNGAWFRHCAERSVFNKGCVRQLVRAFELSNWQMTQEIKVHIEKRTKVIAGSQVVEDLFQRASRREREGTNNRSSPMSIYSHVIKKRVLSSVHRYEEPDMSTVPVQRGHARIHRDAMHPKVADATLPVQKVTGAPSSKPSWYSPGFANLPQAHADLVLIEHLYRFELWDQGPRCWLATFFRGGRYMVRRPLVDGDEWFFVLGSICDSVVALVPAAVCRIGNFRYYSFPANGVDPVIMPVLDLDEWEALTITWESPLGQMLRHPGLQWSDGFGGNHPSCSTPSVFPCVLRITKSGYATWGVACRRQL